MLMTLDRCISAVLGPVLHNQYHQRYLYTIRSVRDVPGRLSDRSDPVLVLLRLARLHEQFPQSGHLHHLQHGIPTSFQEITRESVQQTGTLKTANEL